MVIMQSMWAAAKLKWVIIDPVSKLRCPATFFIFYYACDMRKCVNYACQSSVCMGNYKKKILLIFGFYSLPHNSLESADQVGVTGKRKS